MTGDLTPSEVRARKFASSRRGYDRVAVEQYLDAVADRIAHLESELESLRGRMAQLGIDDLPDLKTELGTVAGDIGVMLEAAREAASGMRSRAAAAAAGLMDQAQEAAAAARGDAWEAGTALLDQATAEAERRLAAAREEALFIRAEAEQEAVRLTGDSRRQADELLRSSREESERILVDARSESVAILEDAHQAAERAQERARALENRRVELMNELEAARNAISDLETEREGRLGRSVPIGGGTVRVVTPHIDPETRWAQDDGAVRILPMGPAAAGEPVDVEAMVAEVEALRAGGAPVAEPAVVKPEVTEPEVTEPEVAEPEVTEPEVVETEQSAADVPEGPVAVDETEAPPADDTTDPAPEIEAGPSAERPPVEETVEATGEASDPALPAVDEVAASSEIDDLFARLRQPDTEPTVPPEPTPDPPVESAPAPAVEVATRASSAESGVFDRRDRRLLPIENRALRGVKRSIVELQNRVLEELRVNGDRWRPGRELVAEILGGDVDVMLQESFGAGHSVAAELVGEAEPQSTGGPTQGAAEQLIVDLHEAVYRVLDRPSDGGVRRLSSDVGRVFRTWRTDEAERRVRRAARRAYHDGLLAGFAQLGVDEVTLVAVDRPCGECGAGTGIAWNPQDPPPAGVIIPPAGPACEATIVPVGAANRHR